MNEQQPRKYIRRVVTGHDAQGRSIFTEDQLAPSVHTNPNHKKFKDLMEKLNN